MTTTQKIKDYILANPEKTNEEVAKACSNTKNFANRCQYMLRKEGKLPEFDPADRRKKDNHDGLQAECDTIGIPVNAVTNYWYKGKHYSIHARPDQFSYLQAIEDIISTLPKRKIKAARK